MPSTTMLFGLLKPAAVTVYDSCDPGSRHKVVRYKYAVAALHEVKEEGGCAGRSAKSHTGLMSTDVPPADMRTNFFSAGLKRATTASSGNVNVGNGGSASVGASA